MMLTKFGEKKIQVKATHVNVVSNRMLAMFKIMFCILLL